MGEARRPRTRTVRTVTAVALTLPVLWTTGCAGVPGDGDGVVATAPADDGNGPDVRVEAQPPANGASPNAIVQGFLYAMASIQTRPSLASQFLTTEAQGSWDRSEITVYDDFDYDISVDPPAKADEVNVSLTGTELASIDDTGHYSQAGPDEIMDFTLRLEKVNGEWRIADVPDRLLISEFDLDNGYAPYVTYFPSIYDGVLIPDQIWLPTES